MVAFAALALLCAPSPEREPWIATAETVPGGENALAMSIGWPESSLSWFHGIGDRADAGARLVLPYQGSGSPGMTLDFGIGLGIPLRYVAWRAESGASVELHIEPGVRSYFVSPFNVTLRSPFGIAAGVQVSQAVRIATRFDVILEWAMTNARISYGVLGGTLGLALEATTGRGLHFGLDARIGSQVELQKFAGGFEAPQGPRGVTMVSLFFGSGL
jgi:hypothetical protein